MRVVLVILIALSLLHPAIASASTVTVRPDPDAVPSDSPNSPPFADEVLYVAGPGEANTVTVTFRSGPDTTVEVTDPGATIEASGACVRVDEHTARCTRHPGASNPLGAARVMAGDGDDRVEGEVDATVTAVVRAFAGPGDDVLLGTPNADDLDGGGGTDTVAGADGDDEITDGDSAGRRAPTSSAAGREKTS